MMKKRTRSSTRFLARLLILCSMGCPLYIKTTKLYIITQMMSSVIDKYFSAVAADLNFGTLRFEPSAAEPSQNALDSIRGLLGLSETLRLDEDLSFGALLRSNLVTEVVVRAQEPLAVPTVPADGFLHARAFR